MVIVEKGAEVGAHILSGAVIDPIGLDRLLPEWRKDDSCPIKQPVLEDRFFWLSEKRSVRIPSFPMPPLMSNKGNFIVSLGNVCRWLGKKAEALGVEIYPGFAATEVLYGAGGEVIGVATGDMGVDKNGKPKDGFTRGIELRGKYTLFAEGARGSLSKTLIAQFGLQKDRDPPKFGIGLKELWQVQPEKHHPGLVQHSFGWPLDNATGGGSFMYHFDENLVAVGFVVHLNYHNPWLSPVRGVSTIQDPSAGARHVRRGQAARLRRARDHRRRMAIGAETGVSRRRADWLRRRLHERAAHQRQSQRHVVGNHCRRAGAAALGAGRAHDELTRYEQGWRASPIGRDLRRVRNVKPLWSKLGTIVGAALGGLDMWTNTLGFTFSARCIHGKPDNATLEPAAKFKPIAYPKPDGRLTFDRLSSVFLSNTNHAADQPVHLHVADSALQKSSEHDVFAGPSGRYCPAGVYEWATEGSNTAFRHQRAELRALQDL